MRQSVRVAVLAAGFAVSARAADPWLRLTSQNFELYTNAGEKRGKEAILQFEQVRDVFLRILEVKATTLPVRIIGFKSTKDFEPYNFREGSAAYYLSGWDRDYIVMGRIGADYFPIAIHEYTHLIIKHTGLEIPAWLNEGLAELYSTLKPVGNKIAIGALIPGRFVTLQNEKWIPMQEFLKVDRDSPHYNEKRRAPVFYAQSWALTHMLYLSEEYRPNFAKLILALGRGGEPLQAFRDVYGKTPIDVERDLRAYLARDRFYAAMFDTRLEKASQAPQSALSSEFETGAALLELLASSRGKRPQAKAALTELNAIAPENAAAHELLGAVAARIEDHDTALKHFARAAQLGSTNPKFYFRYAAHLRSRGEEPSVFLPQLERAVQHDPNYDDANYLIGHYAYGDRDFTKAARHLGAVKKVTEEQAPAFFSMLAYSYFEAGQVEQARAAASRARTFAKSAEDVERTQSLLQYVSRASGSSGATVAVETGRAPELRRFLRESGAQPDTSVVQQNLTVEGTVQQVDCNPDRAVFHVLSNGRTLRYGVDDPNQVVLKNSPTGRLELTCGPQPKPFPVVLEFVPAVNESDGTAGLIRVIEFK